MEERSVMAEDAASLPIGALYRGRRLLVFGGTGFLGKVWLALLLDRFVDLGRVYLVVRPQRDADGALVQGVEERFWAEIATSDALAPVRERVGEAGWKAWLSARITPVAGDVTHAFAGVGPKARARLRGQLDAIVNVAGVVNFQEPLDVALAVNALGTQNLVALARDLAVRGSPGVPILHTSTCYVAGDRTGAVPEAVPGAVPFPRHGEGGVLPDPKGWDLERELAACQALAEAASQPTRDRRRLVQVGMERAAAWGWQNTYTFTKSMGEQMLMASGVPFTIGRPAVIESAQVFPSAGWNEGVNTSSPLIYLVLEGPVTFAAAEDHVLDVIPVDQVAVGMVLSLAELLEGTAPPVYQYGTSDTNPLPIRRFIRLVGEYKRRYYLVREEGNPLVNLLQMLLRPRRVTAEEFDRRGPRAQAVGTHQLRRQVRRWEGGALGWLARPLGRLLDRLVRFLKIQDRIIAQYVPFMATHDYRFSCAHTRRAFSRLGPEDRARLPWSPETIDWRHYILDLHCPGIERHVLPEMREKVSRR